MMPSDRVVAVRDKLNALIDEHPGDDLESMTIRCCIAVSVEEMEKWMYGGQFTPSVMPVNDASHTLGDPTKKYPVTDRQKRLAVDMEVWSQFADLTPDDWSDEMKTAAAEGKTITFIKILRCTVKPHSGLKGTKQYHTMAKELWPELFGEVR